MDATDMHSLFVNFDQKISNVCSKLALLDVYFKNDKEECTKINLIIGNIQIILHKINQLLNNAENDFYSQKKRCDQLWKLISDHVQHIENQASVLTAVPESKSQKLLERNTTYTKNLNLKNLKKSVSSNATPASSSTTTKTTLVKNSNKGSSSSSAVAKTTKPATTAQKEITNSSFPIMEFITEAEFDSIPKYMLSRLTLQTINESVEAFNFTINAKYTFIKKFDIQSTKDSEYKRFQNYKTQENADTKGQHFVTINDIKELSSMKNDATLRKVLTCLRHCKRIKEIRSNKLIRYSLI